MSASKMRKAVTDDNYEAFKQGTPKGLNDGESDHYSMQFVRVWV